MGENKPLRILVVDDDRDILDLLKYNFEKEGFEVRTVFKSEKAMAVARKFKPALIVLDVMMPEKNGIELCRAFRSQQIFDNTYIFFLSARSESYFEEAAFDIGADDYIEKLNGVRMLTNKVTAVLKKNFIIKKGVLSIRISDIVIQKPSRSVTVNGQNVLLSDPEFNILYFLMQNGNKKISIEDLIKILWGSQIYVQRSVVESYVENLQMKIGKDRLHIFSDQSLRLHPAPNAGAA